MNTSTRLYVARPARGRGFAIPLILVVAAVISLYLVILHTRLGPRKSALEREIQEVRLDYLLEGARQLALLKVKEFPAGICEATQYIADTASPHHAAALKSVDLFMYGAGGVGGLEGSIGQGGKDTLGGLLTNSLVTSYSASFWIKDFELVSAPVMGYNTGSFKIIFEGTITGVHEVSKQSELYISTDRTY